MKVYTYSFMSESGDRTVRSSLGPLSSRELVEIGLTLYAGYFDEDLAFDFRGAIDGFHKLHVPGVDAGIDGAFSYTVTEQEL